MSKGAPTIQMEVQGLPDLKKFFRDVEHELTNREIKSVVLYPAGRAVVKKARKMVNYDSSQINSTLKKDLGVYGGSKGNEEPHVLIGPRYREYNINGQPVKTAIVAQHLTEGFKQTDRNTHRNKKRGRVNVDETNPVLAGWNNSEAERNEAINKAMQKKLEKIRNKNRNVIL